VSDEINPGLSEQQLAALRGEARAMSTPDLYAQLDLVMESLKQQTYKSHEAIIMRRQALQAEAKSREDDFCGWAQGKWQWEGDY